MHPILILQTAEGGSPLVVALALIGLLVTAGLSLGVAYVLLRGYQRNRNQARLYLALGLVFLTAGPILIQLLLTNFTAVSAVGRSAGANASKLLGLGAILYAIYGASRPRATSSKDDADHSEQVRK